LDQPWEVAQGKSQFPNEKQRGRQPFRIPNSEGASPIFEPDSQTGPLAFDTDLKRRSSGKGVTTNTIQFGFVGSEPKTLNLVRQTSQKVVLLAN
jgi:hypothetical protein